MESKLRLGLSAFLNGQVNAVMQCVYDTFAKYLHTSDFGVRGGLTEASLKVSLLSVLHMLLLAAGLADNDKVVLQSELYLSDLAKRRFADVAVQSPCGTVLVELKYVPPRYRQGQSVPCFSRTQLQKAVADCAALTESDFSRQRVTTGAKDAKGELTVLSVGDLLHQAQQQVNEYASLLYKTQPSCRMKPIHCVAVVALGGRLTWTSEAFRPPGGEGSSSATNTSGSVAVAAAASTAAPTSTPATLQTRLAPSSLSPSSTNAAVQAGTSKTATAPGKAADKMQVDTA